MAVSKVNDPSAANPLQQPKAPSLAELLSFETEVATIMSRRGDTYARIRDLTAPKGWAPKDPNAEQRLAALKTDVGALENQYSGLKTQWSVNNPAIQTQRDAITAAKNAVSMLKAEVDAQEKRFGSSLANLLPSSELSTLKGRLRAAETKLTDLEGRHGQAVAIHLRVGLSLGMLPDDYD